MLSSLWRLYLYSEPFLVARPARRADLVRAQRPSNACLPYQIWPPLTSSFFSSLNIIPQGTRSQDSGNIQLNVQLNIQLNVHSSCRPFQNRPTTDALKTGRITVITAHFVAIQLWMRQLSNELCTAGCPKRVTSQRANVQITKQAYKNLLRH